MFNTLLLYLSQNIAKSFSTTDISNTHLAAQQWTSKIDFPYDEQ